jgi:L-iditol 2-dehydrogenase
MGDPAMKGAVYREGGRVQIESLPEPLLPEGGLIVRTEACGLCSGELMTWYLDRKAPHILGHEVCGIVEESGDPRFPVGMRVFPHHHAPDPGSPWSLRGAPVHDPLWRSTRLQPGGMCERFAVPAANLADTLDCSALRPRDAALIEPLACVVKALGRMRPLRPGLERACVLGQGVMGLMFSLILGPQSFSLEPSEVRRSHARSLGIDSRPIDEAEPVEAVIVCPGSEDALRLALEIAAPDAQILLFSPLPPGSPFAIDLERHYFQDLSLICSYSCGPQDTLSAMQLILEGRVRAEQVVSDFIGLDELPEAYDRMRRGGILKAMVEFE